MPAEDISSIPVSGELAGPEAYMKAGVKEARSRLQVIL